MKNEVLVAAEELVERGYRVFPLKAGQKIPATQHGCKDATRALNKLPQMFNGSHNLGLATGDGVFVVDVDPEGTPWLTAHESEFAAVPCQKTPRGGRHFFFRVNGTPNRNSAGKLAPGVDTRGEGGYVAVAPSTLPSGPYEWVRPLPPIELLPSAPQWLLDAVAPKQKPPLKPQPPRSTSISSPYARAALVREVEAVQKAPEGQRNDTLNRAAFSLGQLIAGGELDRAEVERELREAARAAGLPDSEIETTLRSGLTSGEREPRTAPPPQVVGARPADNGTGDPNAFALTDAGNAELLAARHGQNLRFNHRLDQWLIWRGHSWQKDADGTLKRLCIDDARARFRAAADVEDDARRKAIVKWAMRSESAAGIAAMLTVAQAVPPIADTGDAWDARPDLLACANGVIDLRTGELTTGRREDKLSLAVPHAYNPQAACPRFERFIAEIMNDDPELIGFLRRALGYTLTGQTREQVFFLCWGKGANGKSRLFDTMKHVLGDLAITVPFDMLVEARIGQHPEAIAELLGRRWADARETTERVAFNEGRIKALAHGDTQTARRMYGSRFTFEPQAKLWLAVNHKPRVLDDSIGFWRSARLIPFTRTFDPHADKTLADTLRAEAPGILRWLVQGAVEWYRIGLQSPAAVVAATEQWRRDADPLDDFIAACCVRDPRASATAKALYDAYEEFCESEGLKQRDRLTRNGFGRRMAERFERIRPGRGKPTEYVGIGLLCEGTIQ